MLVLHKINIIFISLIITSLVLFSKLNFVVYSVDSDKEIIVDGLVENPLKISYNDLKSFPQIWEIVELWCVEGYKVVKFNWTGVPLIYLLSMVKFKENAKEVLFYASDGFTSSITLREALDPTVILALEANGTNLSEIVGREGGYRLIVPCRWGYKWVTHISRIEVIDYDYKGLWESLGYPDDGKMPVCPEKILSDSLFDLNLENYGVHVSGFTTGIIQRIYYSHNRGTLEIKIDHYSSYKSLINFYVENIKNYSHIDLVLDGKKVDLIPLKNQDVITFLLNDIQGERTIIILAYENINVEENVYNKLDYVPTLIIIIILVTSAFILISNYKRRRKN